MQEDKSKGYRKTSRLFTRSTANHARLIQQMFHNLKRSPSNYSPPASGCFPEDDIVKKKCGINIDSKKPQI